MSSPRSMIRNRSSPMIQSCGDIESNNAVPGTSDGKTTGKMAGGFRRWQWLFTILFGGLFIYILLVITSPLPLKEHFRTKESSEEQLTIVMNTFKRHDMMLGMNFFNLYLISHYYILIMYCDSLLLEAIDHYSSCPLIKHIYVVWSEKEAPPQRILAKFTNKAHPTVR